MPLGLAGHLLDERLAKTAGLLHGPLPGRVRGHTSDVQAARAVLEEDQRVDTAKVDRVDVREVAMR